jgi:hypothetical protein
LKNICGLLISAPATAARRVSMHVLYASPNHLCQLYNVTVPQSSSRWRTPSAIIYRMNWHNIIRDLQARGMTLQQIGDAVGMSKGGVHDLMTGRSLAVYYVPGNRLVELHKRVTRRQSLSAGQLQKILQAVAA